MSSITTAFELFDQAPSYGPSSITFMPICVPLFEILFLCNVAGFLSSISLSHKRRKCSIWYEAMCQHLFSGLICSAFPFLFSNTAGAFLSRATTTHLYSAPVILFHGCQNPGSDEWPWDSAHHLRSVLFRCPIFWLTELVVKLCWNIQFVFVHVGGYYSRKMEVNFSHAWRWLCSYYAKDTLF